jgi:hypothetical protein
MNNVKIFETLYKKNKKTFRISCFFFFFLKTSNVIKLRGKVNAWSLYLFGYKVYTVRIGINPFSIGLGLGPSG